MSMWFKVFSHCQSKQTTCLDKSTTISSAANAESLVQVCKLTMPHGVSLHLGGGKPALLLVSCKV